LGVSGQSNNEIGVKAYNLKFSGCLWTVNKIIFDVGLDVDTIVLI
jgi:hypothetical protein